MKIYKIPALALCAFLFVSCGMFSKERTPTETLKAYNEAMNKKDAESIRKLLSKASWKMVEVTALAQNVTPDEFFKREGGPPAAEPELIGEKIEGDTAYVELKNGITGKPEKMPLVREDGEWKVAIDKYMKAMEQQYKEDMKK